MRHLGRQEHAQLPLFHTMELIIPYLSFFFGVVSAFIDTQNWAISYNYSDQWILTDYTAERKTYSRPGNLCYDFKITLLVFLSIKQSTNDPTGGICTEEMLLQKQQCCF